MNKQKLNMVGGGFQHSQSSSHDHTPLYIEWVKDMSADISIHIDYSIFEGLGDFSKRKFAWIAESSEIVPKVIEKVKQILPVIEENYELIFTHDKRLLPLSSKFRFILPNAIPWIKDRKIHNKTKLVSMIASAKAMCEGHLYRLSWIKKLKGKVDHYGRGFIDIPNKEIGLNDYMFSVAMENSNYPSIFCEKITDCFATGTIPIFWGTPDIGDFFNEDGIIKLTEDFDINMLTPELYYSKMEIIKDNFERSNNLLCSEDYMYLNYIK